MIKQMIEYFKTHAIDFIALFVIGGFSIWLMWGTFSAADGAYVIDSKLWSDFAAHLPLIRSFSMGENWPEIEYPTYPGEPIRYHYLFYLLVGFLEKAGLSLPFALNSLSAFGFGLMLYLMYDIAKNLYSSKKIGLLAIFLALSNGSFSFIDYFISQGWSVDSLLNIPFSTHFASFGPWGDTLVSAFWTLNIYTNQRHLGLSFALGLLILRPVILHLYTKRSISLFDGLVSLVTLFLLPWLNKAMFFMLMLILPLLALYYLVRFHRIQYYIGLLLLVSIPGVISSWKLGSGHFMFQPGFLSDSSSLLSILIYWVFNLGMYWILLPVLFVWEILRKKPVSLLFFPLFLIANVFRLSPDMINNHKLINFFWLGLILGYVGLIQQLWKQGLVAKGLVLLLVLSMTFSGFIDFFPIVNDYSLTLEDYRSQRVSAWVEEHTLAKSVFLTTEYLYHPVLLVGRRTYLDYGYFNWSLGYDESYRRSQIARFFSKESKETICQLLQAESIDYVSISLRPDLGHVDVLHSTIATDFDPVQADLGNYTMYDVSANCELTL